MRILTLSAALIATTLSSAAVAANWVLVIDSGGGTVFVDRESIRTQPNGYKRAWTRYVYAEPIENVVTSAEIFKEFDCRERRSRSIQNILLKGDSIFDQFRSTEDWIYERPDSNGEVLLEYVCFGRLP